jgi:hypothetical protein
VVELLEEEARQESEVELSSPYIRTSNMGWMR